MKGKKTNGFVEFTETWRISRVVMLTIVTASTAYGFGGNFKTVLLAALTGFFLAVGGFYMDHLADADSDKKSNRGRNPVAAGILPRKAGFLVVTVSLLLSGFIGFLANPWILLPLGSVILVLTGLASGVLSGPFFKAFSLGILQSLYASIGGLSASQSVGLPLLLICLFLFLAMTGGRVLGDIRDLPYDRRTSNRTIPKSYGVRFSLFFYLAFELASYATGISAYFTGYFGVLYLVCMMTIAAAGILISIYFMAKPEPKRADFANRMSLMLLGSLYIAAMILGKK